MIEQLDGVKETVLYENDAKVKLYHNTVQEGYPFHWHAAMEIIMPIRSSYTVNIREDEIILDPGDILVIPPGTLHQILCPTTSGERFIILCNTSLMNEYGSFMALNAFFSPYVIVRKDAKSKLHDDLQSLLLSIVQTYYQDGLFKYITIYAELMKFLCVLGENMVTDALDTPVAYVQESDESERTATTRAHMTAIYECCVYLRDHSREDISLDDLARQSGFSKFYFSRLFKEFTGMSFVDYLNRSRIMDAEALLVDPDSVITDVALLVGFNSISTFNRVFRKLKGTTPTAFKQMAMQSGYAGRLS